MKLHSMTNRPLEFVPAMRAARCGWRLAWLWAACSLAVGCANVVLDADAPAGFDLGGTWVLDPVSSEATPEVSKLRRRGMSIAMVAQDFPVLRCRRMEIEQNADSMGIAYDGGSYRDVSWGVRERGLWEVNAGWDAGELRILSKARDAKAEETMILAEAGRRLLVRVSIEADGDHLVITRVFKREL
jgi:hypothetical protein